MIFKFDNGLTIAELKEILSKFPDINPDTGEACEVWISTSDTVSNICYELSPLNVRLSEHGVEFSDIILTPKYFG